MEGHINDHVNKRRRVEGSQVGTSQENRFVVPIQLYVSGNYTEWVRGSSLLFWRWTSDAQSIAKDGIKPWVRGILPQNKRKSRKPSPEVYDKILSKMSKYLERGYLKLRNPHDVVNLIDYFWVKKGESDIRVVLNGSSCGLTDALWSPNFWLPTSSTLIRCTSFGYKYVDLDLGEMFLNFPLHNDLKSYSGIDLTPFRGDLMIKNLIPSSYMHKRIIASWERTWMGMKISPEQAVRFYYLAEEFVRGNHREHNNPLRWDRIVLNLLGSKDYNPSYPCVYKWDDVHERIAGDILAYVDDLRAIGFNLEEAWRIARWTASRLQYLGIQDAPRKRRIDNGPWAGSVVLTTSTAVYKTVEQKSGRKPRDM